MSNALTLPSYSLVSTEGLMAYSRMVNSIPRLSAEREHKLAIAYRDNNDIGAAREIVVSQLRSVLYVARGYNGYGLPVSDLIQEGNIGLMKAVKHFDPDRGVRFITFAMHWIRAEINEFVLRNWRIVKIATTKAQRKLFFGLRKSRKNIGRMNQAELEKTAKFFDVKVSDVEHMENRFSAADTSYDPAIGDDEDSNMAQPVDYLCADDSDPAVLVERRCEVESKQKNVHAALSELNERSADILRSRWLCEEGEKATLQELAKRYKISAERVRQVEQEAMAKIRCYLTDSIA